MPSPKLSHILAVAIWGVPIACATEAFDTMRSERVGVGREAVTTASNYLGLKTPTQFLNRSTTPSTNTQAQTAADAYYATWNAPATNQDFLNQFGLNNSDNVAGVVFYNAHELGIGRIVRCTNKTGKTACASENYGSFGGPEGPALDDAARRQDNFATVSMVFDPSTLRVDYVVYKEDGTRANFAQLDTVGLNSAVPYNCTNCHGGAWDDTTKRWTSNSHFLAYDLDTFGYANFHGYREEDQQEDFRKINALVRNVAQQQSNQTMVTTIDGWYDGHVNLQGTRYDGSFLPSGWAVGVDTDVYRKVVVPYCRSCHLANPPDLNIPSVSIPAVLGNLTPLTSDLCQAHTMPIAEKTSKLFWADEDAQLAIVDGTGQVCTTPPPFLNESTSPFPPLTDSGSGGGSCETFRKSFGSCYPDFGPQGWQGWTEQFCEQRGDHLGDHTWSDTCPGGFHTAQFECCP